jgi:hypothetical protein
MAEAADHLQAWGPEFKTQHYQNMRKGKKETAFAKKHWLYLDPQVN